MLWPWENCQENCFPFFIFSTKCKMADESHVTLKSLNCFTDWFWGSNTYPGHMLIRFWCDSDITFLRRLHKLVTVVYFSLINVFWLLNLCGVGGDASFANLVLVTVVFSGNCTMRTLALWKQFSTLNYFFYKLFSSCKWYYSNLKYMQMTQLWYVT